PARREPRSRRNSSDDPPSTILEPHVALRDGRRPQMPTAVTIDIAVGRRVRIRAVARPARRSAGEDEAYVDDARDVGALSFAVPSSKLALGTAAVVPVPAVHDDLFCQGAASPRMHPAREPSHREIM